MDDYNDAYGNRSQRLDKSNRRKPSTDRNRDYQRSQQQPSSSYVYYNNRIILLNQLMIIDEIDMIIHHKVTISNLLYFVLVNRENDYDRRYGRQQERPYSRREGGGRYGTEPVGYER